ncbi:single-stranded DNA-binding protein [Gimesia sp.]|uniref:single-stranded DNA-binding protein n=1 Tax=Gimesia sp. TaxID=2024833 RepID=UPI003A916536
MASFNKVILVGNLTRDVELRQTPGGSAVCEIGLAVNRSWFNKNTQQREEDVTFIDVTLWGRTAEVARDYLSKGRSVLIEGRLQLDQWDDRETGQKRSKLKVVGENMTMLGSGNGGNGGGQQQGYQQPQQNQQYQQPTGNDGWDQPAGAQGWQPDLDNVPF